MVEIQQNTCALSRINITKYLEFCLDLLKIKNSLDCKQIVLSFKSSAQQKIFYKYKNCKKTMLLYIIRNLTNFLFSQKILALSQIINIFSPTTATPSNHPANWFVREMVFKYNLLLITTVFSQNRKFCAMCWSKFVYELCIVCELFRKDFENFASLMSPRRCFLLWGHLVRISPCYLMFLLCQINQSRIK